MTIQEKGKGTIQGNLLRGIMTYSCTCGSPELRTYQIEKVIDDAMDEIVYTHLICLSCCAEARKEWKELVPLEEVYLSNIKKSVKSYNKDEE